MTEPDYTKKYTAEDMNKEALVSAYIGQELFDELKQISIASGTPINCIVVTALKDWVRHYRYGDDNMSDWSFGMHGEW